MKIALLSPYPDITNFGLRTMSAYLRAQGYETQMVFVPDYIGEDPDYVVSEERYSPEVLDELVEVLRGADLVGFSVMTHYFDGARQVTRAVHERLGVPVVWGGFHASVRPEECMRHADYVVVGEGEETLLELVRRLEAGRDQDLSDIPSLVWKRDGLVVKNPVGRLVVDLDRYPPPDWSLEDHWILDDGHIRPLDVATLHRYLAEGSVSKTYGLVGYQTMTSRGCPHSCAYCGNSFTRSLYPGQRYVRFRSVEHVMREVEDIKARFPFVNFFWFSDDSFFGRDLDDLRRFGEEYKRRIGDPFYLLGSPGTITAEKLDAMVEAGMLSIQVGIEHGSPRIQRLFRRSTTANNEKILETARLIARYKDRIEPPNYDVIYDLEYETLEDSLDTLRLISQLPKPYRLQVFTIIYYPGTALYTLAQQDGLITDEREQIYDRTFFERHDSYANTLLFLARTGRFPHPLLRLLTDSRVARVLTSEALSPVGEQVLKAIGLARKVKHHPAVERLLESRIFRHPTHAPNQLAA